MRILLDSNAYSQLMRGHDRVAELVRECQRSPALSRRGWRTDVWIPAGIALQAKRSATPLFPRQPVRILRTCGTCDRRPLLQNSDATEGEGASHSDKRHVDRGSCTGDRSRSHFSRQALRVRRWNCMDPSGGGVRYRRGALKRGALAGYSCGVGIGRHVFHCAWR